MTRSEEIDKLRQGGDGHVVAWGGVSLWRSLMRLDLASSTASSNGVVELQYRRHRCSAFGLGDRLKMRKPGGK